MCQPQGSTTPVSPQTLRQVVDYPHCMKVRAQSSTHSLCVPTSRAQGPARPTLSFTQFKTQIQHLLLNKLEMIVYNALKSKVSNGVEIIAYI